DARWLVTKRGVWTLDVVVPKPGTQRTRAAPRARIGDGISPAANQRLDEAFSFAVRLGSVWTRPGETHTTAGGRDPKSSTDAAAPVSLQATGHNNPASSKPPDGPSEEASRCGAGLVR